MYAGMGLLRAMAGETRRAEMSVVLDDGQRVQVEPAMVPVFLALLKQQRTAARVGDGTILVHFTREAAKVTVWKKVYEDGAR